MRSRHCHNWRGAKHRPLKFFARCREDAPRPRALLVLDADGAEIAGDRLAGGKVTRHGNDRRGRTVRISPSGSGFFA